MRLTTIGGFASPVMASGARALHVPLELREARTLGREQYLAAELDGDRRRVAVECGQQRHLDALQDLARLVGARLEQRGERADDAVRKQDAEERADQRRGD